MWWGRAAPGSPAAIGTLHIAGPLGFSPTSFYNVRLLPTTKDQIIATGAVTPRGARQSFPTQGNCTARTAHIRRLWTCRPIL
jgi:hypothetical protein